MRKSKIWVVALIGLLLAGGLVLARCDAGGCPDGGGCYVATNSKGEAYTSDYCGNGSCAARKIMEYIDGGLQKNATGSCDCK